MSAAKPVSHPVDLPIPEDPNVRAPIAHLHGERPPAPLWFERAIESRPERGFVEVQGARIETLSWGDRGAPGLLFLHGNGAHADWWSFIAPFFAETYRCTAISWSGMGRSDWREVYSFDLFVQEMLAGAQAGGLFESAVKPVVIAHSFGGGVAAHAAATVGDRFAASIILDAGVRPPEHRWKGPPTSRAPTRVYATLEEALGRFRLAPAQPCENLFILDYIARESLRPAPLDPEAPEGETGWTWRFDPHIWTKIQRGDRLDQVAELQAAKCPLAHVYGERSQIMPQHTVDYTKAHAPPGTPVFAIPDAEHHVMLDQPLAVVACLRGLIEGWVRGPSAGPSAG